MRGASDTCGDTRITYRVLVGKRQNSSVVRLGIDRRVLVIGYEKDVNRALMLKLILKKQSLGMQIGLFSLNHSGSIKGGAFLTS
jgi:hypothetical protein